MPRCVPAAILGGDPDEGWIFTGDRVWIERRDGSVIQERERPILCVVMTQILRSLTGCLIDATSVIQLGVHVGGILQCLLALERALPATAAGSKLQQRIGRLDRLL